MKVIKEVIHFKMEATTFLYLIFLILHYWVTIIQMEAMDLMLDQFTKRDINILEISLLDMKI